MVERGEFTGDVIGFVERGRGGGDETDILGDGGQSRQQGDRLELRHIASGGAMQGFRVCAACTDAVRHEDEIEFCRLGNLRKLDIMRKIRTGVGLRIGMTPCGDMVAGRIKESSKL